MGNTNTLPQLQTYICRLIFYESCQEGYRKNRYERSVVVLAFHHREALGSYRKPRSVDVRIKSVLSHSGSPKKPDIIALLNSIRVQDRRRIYKIKRTFGASRC